MSGGANSTLIYPVNVVKSYQQKQISSNRESFFSSCKVFMLYLAYVISEARTRCFLASDWLKFETLPRKFRTLYLYLFIYCPKCYLPSSKFLLDIMLY